MNIKKPQLRYCGEPRPFPEGNDNANISTYFVFTK